MSTRWILVFIVALTSAPLSPQAAFAAGKVPDLVELKRIDLTDEG